MFPFVLGRWNSSLCLGLIPNKLFAFVFVWFVVWMSPSHSHTHSTPSPQSFCCRFFPRGEPFSIFVFVYYYWLTLSKLVNCPNVIYEIWRYNFGNAKYRFLENRWIQERENNMNQCICSGYRKQKTMKQNNNIRVVWLIIRFISIQKLIDWMIR